MPYPSDQPGPNIYFHGEYGMTWLTDGYYLGWGIIGNALNLFMEVAAP